MEKKKKKILSNQNTSKEKKRLGRVLVWDYRKFFAWLFRFDNTRMALSIFGLIFSIFTFTFGYFEALNTKNNRLKIQLSESFRLIDKIRDEHVRDLNDVEHKRVQELNRLRQKNVKLANRISILESESKIFQDSLNACRRQKAGSENDKI